jgi:predicted patatin/cPLA2 family phospholipase
MENRLLKSFKTRIVPMGNAHWACIRIPFSVEKEFGSKARVAVKGTVNGFPFRSSVFPDGSGSHFMMVNRAMREGAKAYIGDTVTVTMEPDARARTITVPKDLKAVLSRLPALNSLFSSLSYSHKKQYVDWITEAKRPETRRARIEKTLKLLAAGKESED